MMKRTFVISMATTALFGASGIAAAQSPNNAPNAPAAQSSPAEAPGAPSEKGTPMNRGHATDVKPKPGMKASQADQKPADATQHAQDNVKGDMKSKDTKSKGASTETMPNAGGKTAADTGSERSKDGMAGDSTKGGTTTGQAGAGSRLSTEQRASVRSAITKQNVKPAIDVNFSISVGARVPRSVAFHEVPTELITIYPNWRGYEYFLVGDQIVVVNPRTLEIVAVLEA